MLFCNHKEHAGTILGVNEHGEYNTKQKGIYMAAYARVIVMTVIHTYKITSQ